MTPLRSLSVVVLMLLVAQPLFARNQWFDHYEAGLKAARTENWKVVLDRMNEAIALKPQEERRARTYGAGFLNYRPYYYRGIAHFHLGNLEAAMRDLERTEEPGPVNLGSMESFIGRARSQLQPAPVQPAPTPAQVVPTPAQPPVQQPVQPPVQVVPDPTPRPVQPTGPTPEQQVLQLARENAQRLFDEARRERDAAVARRASNVSQFNEGTRLLQQASNIQRNASSEADFRRISDLAIRARGEFTAAISRAEAAVANQQNLAFTTADQILSQTQQQLRTALENYFGGRFDQSTRELEQLVRTAGSNNASIWAFLGASHYYSYYLGGSSDQARLRQAEEAFRRAKSIQPDLKLEQRYFSPRVRRFYSTIR